MENSIYIHNTRRLNLEGKMSRRAVKLYATEEEQRQLEKWANGGRIEKRLHDRAKIILLCPQGKTNLESAEELNISRFTIGNRSWNEDKLYSKRNAFIA